MVATERKDDDLAKQWRQPLAGRHTVAFLQYTSGSTSEPRGVIVTQATCAQPCVRGTGRRSGSLDGLRLLAPGQPDMGLIQGVLQPVFSGFLSPHVPCGFLQRPASWLETISPNATCSGAPNFAYDLCVRKIAVDQRSSSI